MLFLKMCEMAMCLFSKLYFKTHLFSEFLCLSRDSVANIRLKVVSLLPQLKSLLVLPADSAHLQHLEETIKELLVVETDRDVLGALQTAIHHLAEIETAMDGMAKMCLYSEEDMVDDRKLREERLIANMEEQIKAVQGAKFDQLITPSAIPSRLRSLGMDRKRSESLPPARSRTEPVRGARPRYSSPEPATPLAARQEPQLPSLDYSHSQDLWRSPDSQFEEKDFKVKNNPGPFSASLENLDTQDSSFLVDAGIKLPSMSSAASMPNLTAVGKVKDQLSRSNSIPESGGNIDGELAKYLISNEEMEHYEAEYHKSAREEQADPESLSPGPSRARGRSESRMKPPSFTSALISRPTPAATAVSVSVNKSPISFSAPIQKPEKQEVRLGLKPVSNKSNQSARNSPPKSVDERSPNQQRWNDGSIERLAEKWAAKRDALLKETGVIAENLQQRKAAMEQKLESVKRSIPKRSMGFTPQSAQKRLSLCETTVNHSKTGKEGTPLTKRKSLDVDIVIAPTESTSEESDEDNTSGTEAAKSPELVSGSGSGSSDSDDSLPPYPATEKHSSDTEKPLPPPPPTLEFNTNPGPLPPPPPSNKSLPLPPTKSPVFKSRINTSSNITSNITSPSKGSIKSSSRLQLFGNSPSKSSMATFKTVTAPQTSVAVSRQLPAPMRSIADSPRLPLPNKSPDSKAPSSLLTFKKINPEEAKKEALESGGSRISSIKPPVEPPTSRISAIKPPVVESPTRKISSIKAPLEPPNSRISTIKPPVEPPNSKLSAIKPQLEPPNSRISAIKSPAKKSAPTTDLSKVKIPQKNDCRSSDVNNPGTDSSVLHINRSLKRVSKIATTQISSINRHDTASFSSFKLKCPEDDSPSVEQKEGKTIVYIENNTGNKLKAPSSILPKERSKMLSPKPQVKSQAPASPSPSPSPSKLKPGRYGGKSLSVDSVTVNSLENSHGTSGQMKSFLARSTNKIAGTKSVNGKSPLGSSENLVGPGTPGKLMTKSGLSSGARRSLGMRMWPSSSPVNSRSPSPSPASPASPASTPSTPSRISKSAHSTLPRTSNISRLRVPGPSPHQRRSYGGGGGGGGGGGVTRSAPATPRHSQGELGINQSPAGSRSSSPVILRRPDNQEKPPSNMRSLSINSMLKRPAQTGPGQESGLARPTTTTTAGNNKSRLQNPPKTFGFSY